MKNVKNKNNIKAKRSIPISIVNESTITKVDPLDIDKSNISSGKNEALHLQVDEPIIMLVERLDKPSEIQNNQLDKPSQKPNLESSKISYISQLSKTDLENKEKEPSMVLEDISIN